MRIDEYVPFAGASIVDELKLLSGKLRGKSVLHVNSTAVGGGVAEILNRMVPLFKELGVQTRWAVISGDDRFFAVTKKFHNLLHGANESISDADFQTFLETSKRNIAAVDTGEDIVFIHDPQPIALIDKRAGNKWLWRCHIDVSNPAKKVWSFLNEYIARYDAAVFSAPRFSPKLPIRQFLISPSIDPLSDKNRDLPDSVIEGVLRKYGIPTDKPIVTQISRFDRLKDPVGVVQAYKRVKRSVDCRLILAGGTATDDPEGAQVLQEVREAAHGDQDIHILLLPQNDIEVNALQRASTVIVQKSLKEGFGLTISEALWKAKPVVAGNVGGIPLQIQHGYSGLLSHSIEGCAVAIRRMLEQPDYARKLGENGREHVRANFLLTRHLKEYMLLFLSLYHSGDIVYL